MKAKSDAFILLIFIGIYLGMGFVLARQLSDKPFNLSILKVSVKK
jgi:hypothetical protein